MDSSLLGENGNPFLCTFTPKADRKRKIYTCPYCDKTYMVNAYHQKHVAAHLVQAKSDVRQDVHLDASDISIIDQFEVPAIPSPPKKIKKTSEKKGVGIKMDLSLLDENGNQLLCASTPKADGKRKIYTCQYCDKTYMVNAYYQKHVAAHLVQAKSDVSQDVHLDASDISIFDQFKVPAIPAPPKKIKKTLKKNTDLRKKLICTYCLKEYVCTRSFKSHMRGHTLQDAALKYPDTQKILDNIADIASASLTSVSNCPSYGKSGEEFRAFLGHVIYEHDKFTQFSTDIARELLTSITSKKCLLPSALINALFEKMEEISSNCNFCEAVLGVLEGPAFSRNVQSQFLLEFILNLTSDIFKFISRTFRSAVSHHLQKQIPVLDAEDKQVIFYVGGSIVRGYLRIGKRNKGSFKWQTIIKVLRERLLSTEPELSVDAQWTKDLDRGGLLYISEPLQEFFIKLTDIVYISEKRNGSIPYETVLSKVTNSEVSVLWDKIIKDSLSEELSVGLMNDIIMCFCKACGRGVAKRKLNELRDRPVIGMATRHAVASRKK